MCDCGRLGPSRGAELGEDARDVHTRCLRGDEERLGDLVVPVALGNQTKNFQLALCQPELPVAHRCVSRDIEGDPSASGGLMSGVDQRLWLPSVNRWPRPQRGLPKRGTCRQTPAGNSPVAASPRLRRAPVRCDASPSAAASQSAACALPGSVGIPRPTEPSTLIPVPPEPGARHRRRGALPSCRDPRPRLSGESMTATRQRRPRSGQRAEARANPKTCAHLPRVSSRAASSARAAARSPLAAAISAASQCTINAAVHHAGESSGSRLRADLRYVSAPSRSPRCERISPASTSRKTPCSPSRFRAMAVRSWSSAASHCPISTSARARFSTTKIHTHRDSAGF